MLLLLDQATSRQLERLASGASRVGLRRPLWRSPRPGDGPPRRSIGRRFVDLVAPLSLFSLGLITVAGLVTGAARAVTDADGITAGDAALVAVMLMATVSLVGQARGILRRRLAQLTGRVAPAPHTVPGAAAWSGPRLIDQVTAEALLAGAPEGIGEVGLPSELLRAQRRRIDTLLWVALVLATLALAGSVALGLASGVMTDLGHGSLGPSTIIRGVFAVLAAAGWALMARMGLDALLHRRRRRRRSALMRLLRYLLRLFRGTVRPGPIALAPSLGLVLLAVLAVTAYGFGPEISRFAAGPGGPNSGVRPGTTPTPEESSLASATPSETRTPLPTPFRSLEPVAIASATTTGTPPPGASLPPSPSPVATATLRPTAAATPSPTPTPIPTPSPSPSPSPTPIPTIDPTLDSDQDGVTDVDELLYGSNRFNPTSTPEHKAYDLTTNGSSCSDGLDNDGDLLIDTAGGFLPPNQLLVGNDPGCG